MNIFEAIKKGNLDIVKELLDAGENVNIKRYGENPLHIACENNNIEIVKLLLQHPNIDVNAKENYTGNTCLHTASAKKSIRLVELLLEKPNIDVNIQNQDGDTPLLLASQMRSNETVVRLLFDYPSVDVNIKNIKGYTLLYYACSRGYVKVINSLLDLALLDSKVREQYFDTFKLHSNRVIKSNMDLDFEKFINLKTYQKLRNPYKTKTQNDVNLILNIIEE